MRLQKFLSRQGVGSRRAIEKLVAAGKIKVDGQVVSLGHVVDECSMPYITVDGQPVSYTRELEDRVYYLLNKPPGVISTTNDPKKRRTVLDLLPKDVTSRYSMHPVGRLDFASEGLLILTNDGAFTNSVAHPSKDVSKRYMITVYGRVDASTIRRLISRGVQLEDGMCKVDSARLMHADAASNTSLLRVSLHDGRNRVLRRLFHSLGHSVLRLQRDAIGGLSAPHLKLGYCMPLNEDHLARVFLNAKT